MPTTRRSRTIAGPPKRVWETVSDPHHLPRWWPAVERVEGVSAGRFTQVHKAKQGRPVRLDFRVVRSEPPRVRVWEQEVVGTPFERVLSASVIDVRLDPERG